MLFRARESEESDIISESPHKVFAAARSPSAARARDRLRCGRLVPSSRLSYRPAANPAPCSLSPPRPGPVSVGAASGAKRNGYVRDFPPPAYRTPTTPLYRATGHREAMARGYGALCVIAMVGSVGARCTTPIGTAASLRAVRQASQIRCAPRFQHLLSSNRAPTHSGCSGAARPPRRGGGAEDSSEERAGGWWW